MMKHTPGPWNVDIDHGCYIAADGYVIASVFGNQAKTPEVRATTLANARLMAAAPDLRDILQKVLDACNDSTGTEGTARLMHVLYREVQQRGAQVLKQIEW